MRGAVGRDGRRAEGEGEGSYDVIPLRTPESRTTGVLARHWLGAAENC